MPAPQLAVRTHIDLDTTAVAVLAGELQEPPLPACRMVFLCLLHTPPDCPVTINAYMTHLHPPGWWTPPAPQ
jgi:hypothetical protein